MRFNLWIIPVLLPAVSQGQAPTYTPGYELPHGRQILAVYIGATTCGPCQEDSLKSAVRVMKVSLAKQAKAANASFSAVGVSLDWTVKDGISFLDNLGDFDEVMLGGNWANSGALRYIWADTTQAPMIPQVVVLERTVDPTSDRIRFTEDHVVLRVTNSSAIRSWVRRGAPIALR